MTCNKTFLNNPRKRSHEHEWQDRRSERRIKEATGALTGNNKLRREGKTDQAVGKIKQVAQKALDKVKDATKCD